MDKCGNKVAYFRKPLNLQFHPKFIKVFLSQDFPVYNNNHVIKLLMITKMTDSIYPARSLMTLIHWVIQEFF